ncbi:MAG: J domain-containing protein [Nannocystaceae bacterium]|nr:J domain-containing protein [Nannocystaceae bacterium]
MPDLPDTDDPYLLLAVKPDATADEVRRAYLRRVKVFKPDRAPKAFQRVREAYERLLAGFELAVQLGNVSHHSAGWDLDAQPPTGSASPDKTRRERLQALIDTVYVALSQQRHDEAARLLLTPDAERLAVDPAFTTPLLDTCCATIWSAPVLATALTARYPDIIDAADSSAGPHWQHPFWDLRSLASELPGWTRHTESLPELTAFLGEGALGNGAVASRSRDALAARVTDEPMRVLAALDGAVVGAPEVLNLLTERADTWADDRQPMSADDDSITAAALVRGLLASLDEFGTLGAGWAKRLIITLAAPAVLIAIGAPLTPLLFALGVSAIGYHAWFDATAALYRKLVRPTIVPWLIATGRPLASVTEQLRTQVSARSALLGLLRPDALRRYPQMLEQDKGLQAFAALARLAHARRVVG